MKKYFTKKPEHTVTAASSRDGTLVLLLDLNNQLQENVTNHSCAGQRVSRLIPFSITGHYSSIIDQITACEGYKHTEMTSAREVMFLLPSVCQQDYTETTKPILRKLGGDVEHGQRERAH